jgi:hypothetical protein
MTTKEYLKLFIAFVAITLFLYDVPGLTPVIPIRSEATVDINTSSATTISLVAHSGSLVTRFSYHLMAAGTTNVSIEYGTTSSTPCDTGTTVIDGPLTLIAQTGMTSIDMVIPGGNDLCLVNSQAVQVGGAVSYIRHNQ